MFSNKICALVILAILASSVAFADDIVVLDSGSADATLDIARNRGARIFVEPF